MDNLAAYKVAGVREAIDARGAELRHLPPYSPDFNPIEQAFAKFKTLLRKAAKRTVDGLWTTHRQAPRPLPTSRVRQLPRQRRLSTLSVKML
jgi:transposase